MFKQSGDCCLAAAAMTASYLPATQDSIALASKAEDPFEAISILHKIPENPSSSPDALRVKEQDNSDCLRVLFGWSASNHNLFILDEINSTSYLII